MRPVDGCLKVRRVEPQPDLLDAARADPETVARWHERLSACLAALADRRR
jgi:O-succinylbenzoate synthase